MFEFDILLSVKSIALYEPATGIAEIALTLQRFLSLALLPPAKIIPIAFI
jgi:hypothetical protein